MERRFSYDLVATALELVKLAEEEHGPLGEIKVHAMLDAFDPGLKRQILMDLIAGDTVRTVTITYDPHIADPGIISAIKAIRRAADFGLKQSKELIDAARRDGSCTFKADLTMRELSDLADELSTITAFRIKGH